MRRYGCEITKPAPSPEIEHAAHHDILEADTAMPYSPKLYAGISVSKNMAEMLLVRIWRWIYSLGPACLR
jgi:hypothetical protein